MNPLESFKRSNRRLLKSQTQCHAFTLAELAVVIATIAVLAMVVLPALAGTANKGGRAQCANNLRQNYVASMMYAAEYKDWLPVNLVHTGSGMNKLNDMHYTYYVVIGGTINSFVSTNSPSVPFTDMGLLYHAGLAGNGSVFFCPDQWGPSYFGANNYLPLLTTDAGGVVRSSYAFNPRTTDPTNGVNLRLYQKTGDLPPHKLLAVDYFANSVPAAPSHFREGGWNVLFTDGSVQFSQNAAAYGSIQNFVVAQTIQSQEQEDFILNCLEFEH